MKTRRCKRCDAPTPLPQFEVNPRTGNRVYVCPKCVTEERATRKAYLDRRNQARRLKQHQLTEEKYWELHKMQQGKCAICFTEPEGRVLAIDHDHATGKVRGLLCTNCNLGLGSFQDSIRLLKEAAKYLSRERYSRD